jgi:outer membrane immunogenic protein
MKRLLLAGLAFSALIMPAIAADMPLKAPPPPPTWTGLYWGVNVGWVGASEYNITNTGTDTGVGGLGTFLAIGAIPSTIAVSHSGFIGGGQIGYNWQVDPAWVAGIEADFQGTTANGSAGHVFVGVPVGVPGFRSITTVYKYELDDLGTVRARLGWLSSPWYGTNLLWYGTAGLAYGQTNLTTTAQCPTFAPPCFGESTTSLSSTHTSVGWTAGAGVEWKLSPVWSVKAEYLYAELGSQNNTLAYTYGPNVVCVTCTSTLTSTVQREHDNIVRFGVNYKLF